MKKAIIFLVFLITLTLISSFALVAGCGKQLNSSSSGSGNYTVSGTIPNASASGISAKATNTVTHIVAVDQSGAKTSTTPDSNGAFSLSLTSGYPYVLGFYNKTGTTITLL